MYKLEGVGHQEIKKTKNYGLHECKVRTEIETKKQVKEEGPQVKPHCELFLADLPPALQSRQFLAGKNHFESFRIMLNHFESC